MDTQTAGATIRKNCFVNKNVSCENDLLAYFQKRETAVTG